MTRIDIASFGGLQRRANRSITNANVAAVARNCDFRAGTLRGTRFPRNVTTITPLATSIRSMYRIGRSSPETQYWLRWTTDVDVATSMIADDAQERIYYTGDGAPKWTNFANATTGGTQYPVLSYDLGIPAPTVAPTLSPSDTSDPKEDRVYVYTYVSGEGEEGMPSPASTVEVKESGTVMITGMQTGPSGSYHITHKRIYRSVTSSTGALGNLLFVDEIPVAQTDYNDIKTNEEISANGPLETSEYDMPPADMIGIVNLQNGITIGFHGKEICPSEPYLPYAYPNKYRQTVDYDIVAIKPFGQSAAVLTKGTPYILTGVDPSALSLERTEFRQSCVSKRSAVDAGDGVIYASPDGLCYIGNGGPSLLTDAFFTREQWQAMNPSTITGAWHDNRYLGFFDAGGGFYWDGKDFVMLDDTAAAVFVDLLRDALYIANGAATIQLAQWNDGATSREYEWSGSLTQMGYGILPPRCSIEADDYAAVALKLYANGLKVDADDPAESNNVLLGTYAPTSRRSFTLKRRRCREFYVDLTGTSEIRYIGMGTSDELRQANAG